MYLEEHNRQPIIFLSSSWLLSLNLPQEWNDCCRSSNQTLPVQLRVD